MSESHPQGSHAAPVESGHEESEIRLGRILTFAVGLVVLSAIVFGGMSALMGRFKVEEDALPKERPERLDDMVGRPPRPMLQRNTTYDMAKFREEEQARLSSYGWVDAKAGVARIPIDRALELVAERGLPKPGAETKAKEGPPPSGPESSKK